MLTMCLNAFRRTAIPCALVLALASPALAQSQAARPRVGVAFGGGSSRGFAHVGVIRWLEEHHIPIDLISGTSMGGLIGGAYASGMSPDELEALLSNTDWNRMFGASSYRYKNLRRKEDARDYPSYLEFGLKNGLRMPPSLNNGQQVDLLLSRITAPYVGQVSFDDLPTPFRCVAVDVRGANQVILDRGPMARALRATMSLPGVFPPVEFEDHLLVDGGAMNNVPADVVRSMGATTVIAINVGSTTKPEDAGGSLLGVVGSTIDAMMQASTRRGLAQADLVITPDLEKFGSLDWRKAHELIAAGYAAAEGVKDRLLPLALNDADWQAYEAARRAKRRTALPQPTALVVEGATDGDRVRIERALQPNVGRPLDINALNDGINELGGLDTYETMDWGIRATGDQQTLVIVATPKSYGPPFLMLATSLQNTTSEDFTFQMSGRFLAYDVLTPHSEVRLDASIGSFPNLAGEYLQHAGSLFFGAVSGAVTKDRFSLVADDAVVAQYSQDGVFGQIDFGADLGRDSEARVGYRIGRTDSHLKIGNPILPSVDGLQSELRATYRYDGQDSAVIPTSGLRVVGRLRHVLESPDIPPEYNLDRTSDKLTQLEVTATSFWPVKTKRDRVFATGGAGTSFDGKPLPTDQFPLGYPFRLGAFDIGERLGDKYVALSAGYLRGIGRLPDFLGGPIFAGAWLENGSAFDTWSSSEWSSDISLGAVMETLIGPAFLGTSFDFDGHRRFYIAIGRLFP